MWYLALVGVAVGLVLGYLLVPTVSAGVARYAAIALLCCLDGLFHLLAKGETRESPLPRLARLVAYLLVAGMLLAISDRLGLDLYIAAVAALGLRIFGNLDMLLERLGRRGRVEPDAGGSG